MTENTPTSEVADATSPDDADRLTETDWSAVKDEFPDPPQDAVDLGTDQDEEAS